MGSPLTSQLTPELLQDYSRAALENAGELLTEAMLLRDNNHLARAYFLAVACVDEVGKALQAFDAQNRNLSDPAVCKRLTTSMESHSQKIVYAMGAWALNSSNVSEALEKAVNLSIHLQRGREASMYSDLRSDPDRAQVPREVVRPETADDCVRLAKDCLANAHRHVSEKTPPPVTADHDRLFTMKSTKFQQFLQNEDFWWYYVAQMHAGQTDLAKAVLGYERDNLKTGVPFREPSEDAKP